jgi:hypothetical protein
MQATGMKLQQHHYNCCLHEGCRRSVFVHRVPASVDPAVVPMHPSSFRYNMIEWLVLQSRASLADTK